MTIWGTPNGQTAAKTGVPADEDGGLPELRARARHPLQRPPRRLPIREVLWDLDESNLGNFLAPQFDKKGKIVSPAAYAKLAAAGYAGIKAGSPKALVAIGETSSNGKDKPKQGSTDSTTPGTFAKMVAQANKKLKFDAWAQDPVPRTGQPGAGAEGALSERRLQHDEAVREGPRQVVRTQEHPGLDHGVRQRDEARRAEGRHRGTTGRVRAAGDRVRNRDPRIPMFIWFVFRDSASSPWQSGVYRTSGAAKPAAAKWANSASGVDKLNGKVSVKGGTANPLVNVNYRDMCTNNVPGTTVGVTWRTVLGNSNIPTASGQTSTQLAIDCTITVRLTVLVVARAAPTEPRSPRTRPRHRPN